MIDLEAMNAFTILLLTTDSELEAAVQEGANHAGYALTVGQSPEDAAPILGQLLRQIAVVIVDLDSAVHGKVWLGALQSLDGKVPAIAASRLNPQFLGPVAQRHGVSYWLAKPASAVEIANAVMAAMVSSAADRATASKLKLIPGFRPNRQERFSILTSVKECSNRREVLSD